MSGLTQNPFASTHSLDTNPFEDPDPPKSSNNAARMEEIDRRERDLERREQELTQKSDHIRKHGRNNFPPCMSCCSIDPSGSAERSVDSLPACVPLYSGGDTGGV